MKEFITQTVIPETNKFRQFLWCKRAGTASVSCVDPAPYTREQPFGLTWSSKDTNDPEYRRPWDVREWNEIEFTNVDEKRMWFDCTLVNVKNTQDCHVMV